MISPSAMLKARILKLRGKKSFGLIAQELGTTRNVVAGVCFREDHPGVNTLGTGKSPGKPSAEWGRKRLRMGPAPQEASDAQA